MIQLNIDYLRTLSNGLKRFYRLTDIYTLCIYENHAVTANIWTGSIEGRDDKSYIGEIVFQQSYGVVLCAFYWNGRNLYSLESLIDLRGIIISLLYSSGLYVYDVQKESSAWFSFISLVSNKDNQTNLQFLLGLIKEPLVDVRLIRKESVETLVLYTAIDTWSVSLSCGVYEDGFLINRRSKTTTDINILEVGLNDKGAKEIVDEICIKDRLIL